MTAHVLIAYGSKHGSTAETAEAIAGMLREVGLEVDVADAARVESLDDYTSVIVGGSLYTGRWHASARNFVKRFGAQLAELPVAVFAMGPKTSAPEELTASREQLDLALKRLPEVGARPTVVFGGVIDPAKLHFPFNRLPQSDARDWDAIREFATAFAERVAPAAV